MEAWKKELYQNELYHHGILGMKWGKKNGPPYPLNASDHSSSEKKAGWRKSLNGSGSHDEKKRSKITTVKNRVKRSSGSRNSKALAEARSKNINELSTKELQEYNNRLNAERNFAELTKGDISTGKKWAMKTAGTIATAIITGVATEAGKKYVKTKLGI